MKRPAILILSVDHQSLYDATSDLPNRDEYSDLFTRPNSRTDDIETGPLCGAALEQAKSLLAEIKLPFVSRKPDEEYVFLRTRAPINYDAGGAIQIAQEGDVRTIAVPRSYLGWQMNRNASGCYGTEQITFEN